jgi:hypothetical protein
MKLLALFTLTLLAQQPEGIPFQGTYENKAGYAYRVTVPPGLTGLKTHPPAPRNAAEAHAECLANQQITPPNYHPTKLAGLPAIETTTQYRRTKSEAEREQRLITALRPATPEIRYEILLDGPRPLPAAALQNFRAIQQSFQLTQLPK